MPTPPKQRIVPVSGNRFWVFPQIQGDSHQLHLALERLKPEVQRGDGFVFLGSQIGQGGGSLDVAEQLFSLQKRAHGPVVWLRGIQEELLNRLLTLHLAPNPALVLNWMEQEHAIGALLASLQVDMAPLRAAAAAGVAPLAAALADVRAKVHPLLAYLEACSRAAVSDNGRVLFVHGGVDPARPLSLQTDAFWWGHPDFFRLATHYTSFDQVYSTLVPEGVQQVKGPGRLAFDSGAGRGGLLQLHCVNLLTNQL